MENKQIELSGITCLIVPDLSDEGLRRLVEVTINNWDKDMTKTHKMTVASICHTAYSLVESKAWNMEYMFASAQARYWLELYEKEAGEQC